MSYPALAWLECAEGGPMVRAELALASAAGPLYFPRTGYRPLRPFGVDEATGLWHGLSVQFGRLLGQETQRRRVRGRAAERRRLDVAGAFERVTREANSGPAYVEQKK